MDHVVSGLEDPNTNVKLAAVKCLHSLSRSVQQLRTSFQDTAVWKPIMKLLQDASDNMMTVASSALCNLLLEFSPSKEVNTIFISLLKSFGIAMIALNLGKDGLQIILTAFHRGRLRDLINRASSGCSESAKKMKYFAQ